MAMRKRADGIVPLCDLAPRKDEVSGVVEELLQGWLEGNGHRMRIAHAARRITQRSIAVAGAKIGSPRAEIPPYVTPQAACDCSVEKLTSQRGTPADELRLGG